MTSGQDLLALTAELVDIPSTSHQEAELADWVEARLRTVPWLTVDRVDANVVARTDLGRDTRLVLAGHLDTVPANGNERARLEDDVLWGLGAADMKSGCAVFLALAAEASQPAVDVTYVFYECEEVSQQYNGLRKLLAQRPDLVACDAAILGEPTGAVIEAGCQGVLRLDVTLVGERAHTARPWMGRNAIHRLGPVLERVAAFVERQPVIDGCEYREALQAVNVNGGVAGNVVPDRVVLQLNHRFAPDRTADEAYAGIRDLLAGTVDETTGDSIEVADASAAAPPSLNHPLLASVAARSGQPARAKLGWTDVAFFAAQGVPAINFGPGDPTLAHTSGERVHRAELDAVYSTLAGLLADGV